MKSALIGLGRMGLRHLDNLLALKLDVVGVSDPFNQARAAAKDKAQLPDNALFADSAEMIMQLKPDVLVIATTAPAHAELTCLAAESGVKAILCEKPMATSIAAARRMIDTCKCNGVRLAINHPMRFMEIYSLPRQMLASAAYGGVASVHVTAGNFGLAMNATHYIEMFRYLTDESPATVQAWFSAETVANPRGLEFEDRAGCLRIVTKSGHRLTIDASSDQGHGLRVNYTARNGQISIDELSGRLSWTVRLPEHRSQPSTRYGMPSDDGVSQIEPADAIMPSRRVLQALLAGEGYPTGEQGLSAVRTLAAAYLSDAENHRIVFLDHESLPEDRVFPWA